VMGSVRGNAARLLKQEARAVDRQLVLAPAEDMFWILRRTRLTSAAALLNNLNNNNSGEFCVNDGGVTFSV
jgi:hypothetical protein